MCVHVCVRLPELEWWFNISQHAFRTRWGNANWWTKVWISDPGWNSVNSWYRGWVWQASVCSRGSLTQRSRSRNYKIFQTTTASQGNITQVKNNSWWELQQELCAWQRLKFSLWLRGAWVLTYKTHQWKYFILPICWMHNDACSVLLRQILAKRPYHSTAWPRVPLSQAINMYKNISRTRRLILTSCKHKQTWFAFPACVFM